MKKTFLLGLIMIIFNACTTTQNTLKTNDSEIVLAFGSCDNQKLKNELWNDIIKNKPQVWIWGGDNVYCDTNDMNQLAKCYQDKLGQQSYKNFAKNVKITGTWDDHDYAKNDGGKEFEFKKESQQLFLDFMSVPKKDKRRYQEGVYSSFTIQSEIGKSVKIINLDTRYFRSKLTYDPSKKKRYLPQHHGTILGEKQWKWLEKELKNSTSEFNIIVSSIQVLSDQHGFESWGNMPHEIEKLEKIIAHSQAKGVIILSGDRHIAEFSKKKIKNVNYPLVDFTSSGLTHVYESFKSEENPYRKGFVVNKKNFGILKLNLQNRQVEFQIRGKNNTLLEKMNQKY